MTGTPAPAEAFSAQDFCVIAAVTDDEVLGACLGASPDIASGRIDLVVVRNARSMAQAYNDGLERTGARICLFAHQDVYLPEGWLDRAIAVLSRLSQDHPEWQVAGPYGMQLDDTYVGCVWDVAMGVELGVRDFVPQPVQALDELLLILRREADDRFDEELPGFHLYGTDLVQTAWSRGRSAWALYLPVVHNNRPVGSLAGDYVDSYRFMRRKWRDRLPIRTTICLISRNPLSLWRVQWRTRKRRQRPPHRPVDSRALAQQAGYE